VNLLLTLPILVPLAGAAGCVLLWRRRPLQRLLALLTSAGLLAAAIALLLWIWNEGVQAEQMGDWPAPFGITLVADTFAAVMVTLAGIVGLTIVVYSLHSVDPGRESFGYYPLLLTLLAGVCGAFLTGDIFNLYVWFEVMLIASFVMLALGGGRAQLEGAVKYVTLNLMSSALFLAAVGILYGLTGTLNMADLSLKLASSDQPGLVTAVAMLFLVAFGIKAAAFPLFFWLPASYHTPPAAVSALFAALLTKVGVYALIRVFTLLFVHDVGYTHNLILAIAGLTMVTGVLGAVAQNEFRRILSFHIVSQIGYMLMGLGLLTTLALTASIFYIIHHIIVKTNLFLISGIVQRLRGTYELKGLGGLYRSNPLVAALFLVPALALAGVPPLSGFFGKLALVKAGLDTEDYAIVAVALGVSLLTLFSMTKVWAEAFWKTDPRQEGHPPGDGDAPPGPGMVVPALFLAALTVAVGVGAEPVMALANRAAEQLLDPSEYVRAVLGSDSPR
jgi:multicomponent Na+:H+ antiporter subunit D